jgi:hypothetical protein
MSETQQGPGWWQASDGKWYAPEQHPDPAMSLPPLDLRPQPTAPPPITQAPMTPFGSPGGADNKKPWWRRWWAIATAAIVALAAVAGIAGNRTDDDTGGQTDTPTETAIDAAAGLDDEPTDGEGDEPTDIDEPTDGEGEGQGETSDDDHETSETDASEQPPDDSPPPSTVGSRDEPYPIGLPVTIEIDSFGDGDGSIWTMTVLGPGTDLTQAVALENQFNDPPPDGSIFYGVPVSLTLESANKEPLSTLFNLELELFGPVTLSIVDNGFEEGCGVAPGAIDPFKEVFIGGTVAGTVCLAVPADDVAAEVLLTTDSIDGDRIYFATTGEAVEVTPDGQDGDSAAQPPPLDETADPGGRTNPHPIGEAITVKVDSIGDGNGSVWTLTVDGPGIDLTQAVADENQFNSPPPDGSIFYGVPVSLTLEAATKEPLALLFNVELEFFGPASLSIIDLGFDEGCGVTPNEIDRFREVFVNGTVSGVLCLAVSDEDVAADTLLTIDSIEGDRLYFATS